MDKFIFFLLVLILIFNTLGSIDHWYQRIWWFDIPMHLVGGAWVMLLLIYLLGRLPKLGSNLNSLQRFLLLIGLLALVGVFWEFFEYVKDVYAYHIHTITFDPTQNDRTDTLADLLNNFIGGFIAFGIWWKLKKLKLKSSQ